MTLTEAQKKYNKRERTLQTAKQCSIGTYMGKVAAKYQRMVRAEAGAKPAGMVAAVMLGAVVMVWRDAGQCVCVTCGKVGPWTGNYFGGGAIETGHFVPGRYASILFEPSNSHPQCKHCNHHLGGNQANYELFIQYAYGRKEPDRLRRLKNESRRFTHEELVDMKLEFQARLKAAEEQMKGS